jgi:mono/diheme cytochrome c family protein
MHLGVCAAGVCAALVVMAGAAPRAIAQGIVQGTPRSSGQQSESANQQQKPIDAVSDPIWPNLTPNQDPAAVSRGKPLFAANCAFCHGTDATGGNSGPDLVRSVLVNHDEHGDLIGPVIRGGRADKGMPKLDLTDAQISDLVAFLHQRNRDARLRFTYKVANVAVGDAAAGKAYFEAHCSSCHSPAGDLAGIAAKYPSDELQQRWIYPGTASSEVTVTLASGQKYSGKLEHLDEFDVSLYDAQGDYHSFPITAGTRVAVKDPLDEHYKLLNRLNDKDMHNVTTYLESLK